MHYTSLVALLALTGASASPLKQAEEYKHTGNVVDLKQTKHKSKSSKALHAAAASSGKTMLKQVEDGAGFAVAANLGGTAYDVIFDSGSSDLWVPKSTFQCVNGKGTDVSQAKCDFKSTFDGTFDEGTVSDTNFNITYGDGEFVVGKFGYETVKVAGVEVKKQQMALATEAYFEGEGISGLMGFAFGSITSQYKGTDPADDSLAKQITYKPWIMNAIDNGKIDPYFSLALERGATRSTGYLGLGSLPDITFDHTFASTPMLIKNLEDDPITATRYSFYTIKPDAINLDGTDLDTRDIDAIVDSGTTLMYLPPKMAAEINAAFDPPAVYLENEGVFEVECDATAPTVALKIGGTRFPISPHDLIPEKYLSYDSSTGMCVTGIQPEEDVYILGDIFLKNVVAVFDIGKKVMKFAPHETYSS